MTAFFSLLARLPLAVLHALGRALGWLAYWGSPSYRRRFQEHLVQARVDPKAGGAAIGAAGQMVAELPRMWLGAPVPVRWTGRERVDQALAGGRGVIFLTPHLGCFEVTARALSESFGDITVLYRPARKRWLEDIVARGRQRERMHAVPTTIGGVKSLLKALRAGQAVGLLPDQVPPDGLGVWAPFFGREAYTMTLVGRLVQQTGAAVLLIWGERLPSGCGYAVHVQPGPAEWPTDAIECATLLNAQMESLIALAPGQYLWGYSRYKAPRALG